MINQMIERPEPEYSECDGCHKFYRNNELTRVEVDLLLCEDCASFYYGGDDADVPA